MSNELIPTIIVLGIQKKKKWHVLGLEEAWEELELEFEDWYDLEKERNRECTLSRLDISQIKF